MRPTEAVGGGSKVAVAPSKGAAAGKISGLDVGVTSYYQVNDY